MKLLSLLNLWPPFGAIGTPTSTATPPYGLDPITAALFFLLDTSPTTLTRVGPTSFRSTVILATADPYRATAIQSTPDPYRATIQPD